MGAHQQVVQRALARVHDCLDTKAQEGQHGEAAVLDLLLLVLGVRLERRGLGRAHWHGEGMGKKNAIQAENRSY